ncbi:NUDIX hydrolase [Aliarcobacter cibarius]|jgi:8-oxo-dGTP pyrophosphatase MutT (NUDIX family)|uniref:NUDIX domain-containing protein n=1 Tax=Aliarcobacter cibarius TaxID=255507 RepID=A0ABY2V5J6_9BACT|nr:NUDIX domain-containing protein [Aliarcobacter cibarius]MBP9491465.1 NUDIX domain-containing protein [Aliarcobacter sp.]QEZ89665.1 coenzyme A pyrophosphatase [Aliarcobacter cibarius]TLT00709.1 NUDIX domain-containing protein [Aliarcobacter cibarius]TLT01003.1 NUDIX domain-containing protein [Aliarcobacter cibarius]
MQNNKLKSLKKILPKHPNILGRDRFFNSAVLIPLVKIEGEIHLLFQKRAAHIKQGGDICFPGGGFDKKKDKNFKDTVYRELYEELGILKEDVKIYGQLDTYSTSIGVIIEPFIGKIKKKAIKNIKIDKNEVEKFLLIPLKFFYETKPLEYKLKSLVLPYEIDKNGQKIEYFPTSSLGLPKTYHEPWGNDNHKIWVYKWEDEVIWGITSMLIIEFLKKFNKIK